MFIAFTGSIGGRSTKDHGSHQQHKYHLCHVNFLFNWTTPLSFVLCKEISFDLRCTDYRTKGRVREMGTCSEPPMKVSWNIPSGMHWNWYLALMCLQTLSIKKSKQSPETAPHHLTAPGLKYLGCCDRCNLSIGTVGVAVYGRFNYNLNNTLKYTTQVY